MKIDLNCDMGEGFGSYRICDDDSLLERVSSANIACGFHAGDPVIMDRTVRRAKEKGVEIGAHPGVPDLVGFGRRPLAMDTAEAEKCVVYQIGALQAIAAVAGHHVTHVCFHAALGNMAAADTALATVLVRAIMAINRDLIIFSKPGSEVERAAERAGVRVVTIFLPDRAYASEGELVSRKLPGSVITDVDTVRSRVRQFMDDATVTAIDGARLPVRAQSIVLHSDTAGAEGIARAVRQELEANGAQIVGPAKLFA